MSNLLSQASLVMIPSGYKEDTVYCPVPTNGNGDLSFTRASNGTRVNSAGLVEVVAWNLVLYSEDFTSGWSASNTVVTANQTTAPNGTTTADLIVDNTNNTSHSLTQSVTNLSVGLDYYYSIYVKNNNHTWVALRHDNGGTFNYFNISTGVKGTNTQANSTIENVGNGWYKLIVPFNVASSSSGPEFYLASADGTYIYVGTGTGVYIYGASYTLSAKPYFPTTDRLNVPRLTYQNGGGGCPSLLLEKQSTNYITYSEDYTNVAWVKNGVSVTGNTTTSPDGTQNADKLTSNDPSGSVYRIYETNAIPSDSVCSVSCYYKYDNWQYAFIVGDNYNGVGKLAVFDLINATNTFVSSGYTATITNVGNGWYRCTMTGEMGITAYCQFGLAPTSTAYNNISIANGKNLYVWGIQREVSSYATSYIPTTSSSATRVADNCFKTGISSLIGQTEGALFVDFKIENSITSTRRVAILSDGTGNERVGISLGNSGLIYGFVVDGGVTQAEITSSGNSAGRYKVAIVYKANDFAFYINGTQIGTDTSGSIPSCSRLDIGQQLLAADELDGVINELILFATRLTNAELASLTTI